MVQSCAVGKIEANLWLLWEGMRFPFTARQWGAQKVNVTIKMQHHTVRKEHLQLLYCSEKTTRFCITGWHKVQISHKSVKCVDATWDTVMHAIAAVISSKQWGMTWLAQSASLYHWSGVQGQSPWSAGLCPLKLKKNWILIIQ